MGTQLTNEQLFSLLNGNSLQRQLLKKSALLQAGVLRPSKAPMLAFESWEYSETYLQPI